jgi:hypothetical protein
MYNFQLVSAYNITVTFSCTLHFEAFKVCVVSDYLILSSLDFIMCIAYFSHHRNESICTVKNLYIFREIHIFWNLAGCVSRLQGLIS